MAITIAGKQYQEGSVEATNALIAEAQRLGTGTTTQPITTTPVPGSGSYIEDLTKTFEPSQTTTPTTYSVPSGSNLTWSAKAMGITLEQLLDANPEYKANPDYVQAGATLKYPTTAPQTTTPTTTPTTETATTTPTAPTPIVQTSDAERTRLRNEELAKAKAEMESGLTKPTQYSSLAEFDRLRKEQGIVNDEQELQALNQEAMLAKQALREFSATAGEGTSEAGRIGMMSEKERNLNFRLEGLAIREQGIVARMNAKNAYISTALQLGEKDYNRAREDYEFEFNKNLRAIDMVNDQLDDQKKDALTTFTTLSNLISDKGITELTPVLRAQLESSALQAGLPTGVVDLMLTQTEEKDKIENIYSRDEGIFAVMSGADGVPYVKQLSSATGGTPVKFTATEQKNYEAFKSEIDSYKSKSEALTDLEANKTSIIQKIGQAGYDLLVKDIDSHFGGATGTTYGEESPLDLQKAVSSGGLSFESDISNFLFQ